MTRDDEHEGILDRLTTLEKVVATQEERAKGLDYRLAYIQDRVDGIYGKIDGLMVLQYSRPSWLMSGVFAIIAALVSGLLIYALK
jgi:uncharacterized coiled-coil protein SlyX